MNNGIKVVILQKKSKDKYGYITRRLNAHTYEIYGEITSTEYLLSKEEFYELNSEDKFLYGIRDKIR